MSIEVSDVSDNDVTQADVIRVARSFNELMEAVTGMDAHLALSALSATCAAVLLQTTCSVADFAEGIEDAMLRKPWDLEKREVTA